MGELGALSDELLVLALEHPVERKSPQTCNILTIRAPGLNPEVIYRENMTIKEGRHRSHMHEALKTRELPVSVVSVGFDLRSASGLSFLGPRRLRRTEAFDEIKLCRIRAFATGG